MCWVRGEGGKHQGVRGPVHGLVVVVVCEEGEGGRAPVVLGGPKAVGRLLGLRA